jgi:putative transposase
MDLADAKRLKQLEEENRQLKEIVADQALNIKVLEHVNSKKW